MVTPAAKREAVAHLRTSLEVSERRACTIIAADRSAVRYLSRRPDDTALRARLRELADQRRRFGYRRLHVLLRSEGWTMNRKKTQRLYGEEGLAVRRCRSRRRLNEHLFFSMNHARAVVAGWVDDFNTARPHSAIGYMTPAAYAATLKPQRASALRHLESSAPMPVAPVALTRNSQPQIPVTPG